MNSSSILRHSPSHRAKLRRRALFKGWPPLRTWKERQNTIKPGRIMSEADSNDMMRRMMESVRVPPGSAVPCEFDESRIALFARWPWLQKVMRGQLKVVDTTVSVEQYLKDHPRRV